MIPQLVPALGGGPDAYLDFDFRFGQEAYWINRQRYGDFTLVPGATSTGGAGFGTVQRNGVWQSVPANAPLIGDGGLSVPEGQQNIWPRNNGAPSVTGVWPIATGTAVLSPGTVPSIIAGAEPVLLTTTTTSGRAQINLTTPADTLTRTFTVWLERKAVEYSVAAFFSGGPAASTNLNGQTGVASNPAFVRADGPNWWRIDIPVTNAGLTTMACYVQIVGAAGQSANLLCPMNIEGEPKIGPPIVTTGLAATRTAVGQSVGGLVLPSAFTVIATQGAVPNVASAGGGFPRVFSLSNGAGNYFDIYRNAGSSFAITAQIGDGASAPTISTIQTTGRIRVAGSFEDGVGRLSANGLSAVSTAGTLNTASLHTLYLQNRADGLRPGNSNLENIRILPYAMDAAQLQAASAL